MRHKHLEPLQHGKKYWQRPLAHWSTTRTKTSSRPSIFEEGNYRDVCYITDATEVFIGTPKSLKVVAACYSDHKHHHTAQYLISINTNGHSNHVSWGWGGRACDNHATQHCGFLGILEPVDMVVPPRQNRLCQIAEKDVRKTHEVADRLICVEQAIRRIKCFKFPRGSAHHTYPYAWWYRNDCSWTVQLALPIAK